MATLKIKDNNGNWQLVGAPSDEVKYTTQVLTDEQKAQARDNIDAQNKIVGVAGQFVSFDENGNAIAQTIDRTSVIETNQGLEQKFWRGTKAEYDAIETKDEATMYIVTDDNGESSDSNVEEWVFTLEDGSIVTKKVVLK